MRQRVCSVGVLTAKNGERKAWGGFCLTRLLSLTCMLTMCLAGQQGVLADRIVRGLRRGGDHHHLDGGVGQDLAIVGRERRGLGQLRHLGETVRLDVADMELVDLRIVGGRYRADAPAPADPDDAHLDAHGRRFPRKAALYLPGNCLDALLPGARREVQGAEAAARWAEGAKLSRSWPAHCGRGFAMSGHVFLHPRSLLPAQRDRGPAEFRSARAPAIDPYGTWGLSEAHGRSF